MDTDIKIKDIEGYFVPVETRIPLKFGPETLTHVTCFRVRVEVEDSSGKRAHGWGETPLSVQWVWPSSLGYEERHSALKEFSIKLAYLWKGLKESGHPMEIGHAFQQAVLPLFLQQFNQAGEGREPMPWLAALVCCSPYDLAIHDAFGVLHEVPVYKTYNRKYMNHDLSHYISPAEDTEVSFACRFPEDFFIQPAPQRMVAWHLVGGKDLLHASELTGSEPRDGYPLLLSDWIERDELKCLKIKLTGTDTGWDYNRLVEVGKIAINHKVNWLTADFNCTVKKPEYVNELLDRLMLEYPRIYGMILYVEQPFPYDLEQNQIDVHSVSARKPLFMDESAHDWRLVSLGRRLGWTGVALKTCKTQTGALLSACWAKAHGMTLMVQDLTNPMLAQIPHVLLAAHVGTIMGIETNAMQFYPEASRCEAEVHPGLYTRRRGVVDLSTVGGPGFGYRTDEIRRKLPAPVFNLGEIH